MKKLILPLAAILLAAGIVRAVEQKSTSYERFYGKITKVDTDKKSVEVHNKKRDQDARFVWDAETHFLFQRKPIDPIDLKIGQNLIISYVMENDTNMAKRIIVRAPSSKKKAARTALP